MHGPPGPGPRQATVTHRFFHERTVPEEFRNSAGTSTRPRNRNRDIPPASETATNGFGGKFALLSLMSLPERPSGTPAFRTLPALFVTLVTIVAFALVATPVAAHGSGNHGTIKVHDEATADPPQRNEPHVDCVDFWVQGFGMSDDSGTLVFYSWPPTGDKTVVMEASWDGEETEKKGWDFLVGPLTLDAGHYRVEAFLDSGHPGNEDHFSKAKMFWVEPCEAPPQELGCPPDLLAASTNDGAIELTWTPAEGSDGTNIYRAVGDGDFEFIALAGENVDMYVDEDVEVGVTYTYTVTGLFGNQESTGCEEVEVTMIPNFTTAGALAAAAVLGTVGYAFVARRKR